MSNEIGRRDLLSLLGVGGVVFASGLAGCGASGQAGEAAAPSSAMPGPARARPLAEDFFFLQLSDTHWGFKGPANPEAATCLKRTIATINAARVQPDFVVFTGDLTHTTDDAKERAARMAQFKEIVAELKVKRLVFLPGEHDAAPDRGETYRAAFGPLYQAFTHKGVHFVALDNASAPGGALGEEQLAWLKGELARVPADAPLVVLAHRPLFELYPDWEWTTKDGARALELLSTRQATVFYGHIHQEHHHVTGRVSHHSARSLVFPLPAPGAVPKRAPLPWDEASPDHGLGHRAVVFERGSARLDERAFT